jgi:hypothetical protein
MEKLAKIQRPEMPDEFVDLEYDLHRVEASRGVLELAVRQLRAFALCLTASRTEADDMVEDTLMLFLAEDRILRESDTCFAELLDVFRRVHGRAALIQAHRPQPERQYAGYLQLPMQEREVAALVMGGGMSAHQAAGLLKMPGAEAERLVESIRRRPGLASLPEWPFLPAGATDQSSDRGGGAV